MKSLDFLIVGAQKCATTTLFEQLRVHPDIVMPLEKEVPFFTESGLGREEWAAFADHHFGPPGKRLWGKATPQYLCDPSAAERIAALMPDTKIVVILRDPIERSWSHYRMDRRRGTEDRPFADVVRDLLQPETAERNRTLPVPLHEDGFESESAFHVAWSEYGRSLAPYLEHFGPDQLLVLYLEDLASNPTETLDRLLVFLGLEAGFRPPALGKVVHAGGGGNRIPHGARVWLRERALVRKLWHAVPDARRGRMRFLYERWNGAGKSQEESPGLPVELQSRLERHFAADLDRLLRAGITPPPWADRYLAI
jgi:hypothetical protein